MLLCVFFPFILDVKFIGCTSRGHTGGKSHRISHPPSFCGACMPLFLSREGFSAVPCRLHLLGIFFFFFCKEKSQLPGSELSSQRVRRLRGYQLNYYRGDRQTSPYYCYMVRWDYLLSYTITNNLFNYYLAGRPGSSEVPRNPLTRWDVSSTPANGIFLTKKLKTKIKMPNGWRTIKSLVHKIRLHGRRGKGMAESFSREKLRHVPQKEGG